MANEYFNDTLRLAAKLDSRGDHADAITAMVPWASWNLPPFENTILAYNLSQMFLKTGRPDEALVWLDWGIEHERTLQRTFVAEHKAACLFEQGRRAEAAQLWRELLASGWLDEKSRAMVENNLRVAENP
jgi:predicted negative regulator of RcsB-dependent stress response